ncbi:MAG: hypothetical protein OEX18_08585 [Candidatus Krumholzibacteria bacterium]|nr:hypothetical protein [Candidatus Krumholzibacteria bacterium]MDH4337316.1 hypothetical protein [Candidatus Krumholzibacteria bacterium]MDH5269971.1 hypothetical protein [Candidatus Krumholzibacteria bacterium]MDH5627374.1 hypothetical protein [Candidatus Krumholzibacteria bacterium]
MVRKIASLVLLLAAVAAIAGAIRWRSASAQIGALDRERNALQAQLDTTRSELRQTGLRYRGFLSGMESIPDSIRMAQAGATMQQTNLYRKAITTLEGEERRLARSIEKTGREIAAAQARRRSTALPLAVVAGALLLTGGGLLASVRPRRLAS